MEELVQLRTLIEQGDYDAALRVLGDMEDMSRDDKITKIESFLEILLLHLIKKHAEQRFPRSWQNSILNAVEMIQRTNKRRKAGGTYLPADELRAAITEVWPSALRNAALEAFEGQYEPQALAAKINQTQIIREALQLIGLELN